MTTASISQDGTKISVECLRREADLVKQVPGSKWVPRTQTWDCPKSWATWIIINGIFKDRLEVTEDLKTWVDEETASRISPSLALREALDAPGHPSLYPYQRAGAEFLRTAERALLCDGLGAGKTRQAISGMIRIFEEGGNPFPALVVCPNSTKMGWKREFNTVWPGLSVEVVRGSAAQRRKQLETPHHVYIMNWEGLRSHSRLAPYGSVSLKKCVECGGEDSKITESRCQVHIKELNRINFNTIIGDELHRAKDPKAQTTRALFSASGDARYRFGLTGTPIADAVDDLWAPMHFISPEEFPGKSKYLDYFAHIDFNVFGQMLVLGIKEDNKDDFFKILDPRLRRMPKDLVLKHLPPVVKERRDVEMGTKQKKAYEQMRDKMVAELEDGTIMTSTTPLTNVTRLLQFASSYAEVDVEEVVDMTTGEVTMKQHVTLTDPSCKIDAFIDDLPDFGDDSVVVFAQSRQLIELLAARFDKMEIEYGLITGKIKDDERQQYMDDFQAGKIKYILCTTGAGGTGITLTKGRVCVFLSRPWSSVESMQAEGRVHRIGSEIHDSVSIIDYVSAGTIEESVHEALSAKGERLEEILRDKDLLKRMITGKLDEDNEDKDSK